MAAITRLGWLGPSAAYPGFAPKAPSEILVAVGVAIHVAADDRLVWVSADDRLVVIAADDRVIAVPPKADRVAVP